MIFIALREFDEAFRRRRAVFIGVWARTFFALAAPGVGGEGEPAVWEGAVRFDLVRQRRRRRKSL